MYVLTKEEMKQKLDGMPEKQLKQMAFFGWSIDDEPPRNMRQPEAPPVDEYGAAGRPTHSIDFASVNWFGERHSFTDKQSAVVGTLWTAWESDSPDVREQSLLREAESDSDELRFLFRNHAAWGTMIQRSSRHGGKPGCFRLVAPKGGGS